MFGELEKNSINIKTKKTFIEQKNGYKEEMKYLETLKVCISFIYEVLKLLKLDVPVLLSEYLTKDYCSEHLTKKLPPPN